MEAINRFKELFLDVWNEGVFGLNASEIIIGIISTGLDGFIQVTMEDYLIQKNIMTHMQTQTTNILNQDTQSQHQEEVKNHLKLTVM